MDEQLRGAASRVAELESALADTQAAVKQSNRALQVAVLFTCLCVTRAQSARAEAAQLDARSKAECDARLAGLAAEKALLATEGAALRAQLSAALDAAAQADEQRRDGLAVRHQLQLRAEELAMAHEELTSLQSASAALHAELADARVQLVDAAQRLAAQAALAAESQAWRTAHLSATQSVAARHA